MVSFLFLTILFAAFHCGMGDASVPEILLFGDSAVDDGRYSDGYNGVDYLDASVPAIFVFGDSTADVGMNNFLSKDAPKANFPHNGIDYPGAVPTGRYSNGYNGVDYLAMMVGFKRSPPPYLSITKEEQMIKGVNFASGGSGIMDKTEQVSVSMFEQTTYFEEVIGVLNTRLGQEATDRLLSKSLFFLSTGSNDIFAYNTLHGDTQNNTSKDQFIASLASKFEEHLTTLYKLGARKLWVVGTSNIGCIPNKRSINPSGECIETLNDLSRRFSKATGALLHHLSSTLSGLKYSFANAYQINAYVHAKPHLFGFKELKTACCGSGRFNGESACTPNTTYCSNRHDYAFWDWYHPTEAIYKLVATRSYCGSQRFATPINVRELVNI